MYSVVGYDATRQKCMIYMETNDWDVAMQLANNLAALTKLGGLYFPDKGEFKTPVDEVEVVTSQDEKCRFFVS